MLPVSALILLMTIKLYLKKLWRSLALMSLKLKKVNTLLKFQLKFFALTFLTLEVA